MKRSNSIAKSSKSPLQGNVRKGYKAYVGIILCITMFCSLGLTAFAADDPVIQINKV